MIINILIKYFIIKIFNIVHNKFYPMTIRFIDDWCKIFMQRSELGEKKVISK